MAILAKRSKEILDKHYLNLHKRTDQLFSFLLILQWLTGILIAYKISPRTWSGVISEPHIHINAAILLGLLIIIFPLYLVKNHSGRPITRHMIGISQMLFSALLIHLSGGRIETHFHVFGSLAFLAFYRDWKVLISASIVVAADHFIRGVYWPQSVFGVLSPESWRWFEHTCWVIFEDTFLIISIYESRNEMKKIADYQAQLENTNELIEAKIVERNKEVMLANEKLSQSNADLENFASIASHDLQEPLRKISFFGKMLEDDYSEKLDEEGKEYLQIMTDASKRMGHLISDLLDLSRVNTRGNQFEEIDLSKVINLALKDLDLRIKDTKANINIGKEIPRIKVDGSQIKQLFQNIISNSLKYHRDNISPRIDISFRDLKNESLEIRFRDNGIGIKPEYLEQVFLPFKRLHSRKKFEGTGMGLAICKKIVERHHGKIAIASKINEGSTFSVILPKDPKEEGKHEN